MLMGQTRGWRRIGCILLPAFAAGQLIPGQSPVPSFDQYAILEAPFKGKPAPPVFKSASERKFRTVIRENAVSGPNFAGHFIVAEWGCGAGCVSIVLVDAVNGAIHPGPFRLLSWEMRKYEGKYAANDDTFEQLSYRLNSRLLVARGCPEQANCASYFYEWSGSQFKLLRKVPSVPLGQ